MCKKLLLILFTTLAVGCADNQNPSGSKQSVPASGVDHSYSGCMKKIRKDHDVDLNQKSPFLKGVYSGFYCGNLDTP
jgi:hypothetical protein